MGHKVGAIEEKIPIVTLKISTGLVKSSSHYSFTACLEPAKVEEKPGSTHSTGRALILVIRQLQLEAQQQHDTAFLTYSREPK